MTSTEVARLTPCAEKVAFAEHWNAKGVCPGCGSDLTAVAGEGIRHYRPGLTVQHGPRGHRVTGPNEVLYSTNMFTEGDPRLCPWSADDLTDLVLIGSHTVSSAASTSSPPGSARTGVDVAGGFLS